MKRRHLPATTPDAAQVLTKATRRAADELGLKPKELGRVLGISPASLSRFGRGRTVAPESKEGELALLLVRLFRSLDALMGGDGEQARRWLRAQNHHLSGVPAELIQTIPGLVRVDEYLDAVRGR